MAPATTRQTSIERLIVLGLGAILVAAMIYIVVEQVPIASEQFAIVRVLLALMAGVVGAFMPGAIFEVEGKFWGFAVRAGGAAAFFFVVFWLTRAAAGPLSLLPLAPDLRSRVGAAESSDYFKSPAVMVLPVAFRQDGRAPRLVITGMTATLDYGAVHKNFKPIHVTELTEGSTDTGWLPQKGNILMPLTFDLPNAKAEIAFYDSGPQPWRSFLDGVLATNLLKVSLQATTDHGDASIACTIDLALAKAQVTDFETEHHRPPQRLTLEC